MLYAVGRNDGTIARICFLPLSNRRSRAEEGLNSLDNPVSASGGNNYYNLSGCRGSVMLLQHWREILVDQQGLIQRGPVTVLSSGGIYFNWDHQRIAGQVV